PGILGHVVAYDLMTAPRPQPQLAVQGALAMAAVALARRYRTDMGNHPSLFLLNIAKSGSGKEHAKRVIEECLGAAGMETLIGGAGYASGVAVFSRLQSQPRHLSIIDEFGRLLEAAGRSSNEHKTAAITALMEAYGRGNGTMLPTSYSTRGMTAKEREAQEAEKVIAPNISMLSMSTPDAFYGSITDRSIQDGFLPRFIIVESSIGRQKMKKVTEVEVPDTIVEWLQYVEARAMGGGDVDGQRGNLADQAWNRADRKPPLLTIPFDDEAHQVLSDLEDRVLARQEELDREGLAEMMVRTRENAMRVALIVAMATDPTTNSIDATATKWAADYVMHYAEQAVAAVRERIASSEFGKMLQVARQVIDARGHMGGTLADLRRNSRQLRGLQPRLLSEVLEALQEEGSARLVKLKTASGRGRPREAWVHPRYITSEATDTETGAGPSQAETDPSNFRRHTGDGASTPETQQ
ncbi:MAG: YfjI family protein, partial [Proteobacteria bacterium]|nr:YfjI family protein [Pseudomonadota bacterium]